MIGTAIDFWINAGAEVTDATTEEKGIIKISGDFGGTADAPTLEKISSLAQEEKTVVVTVLPDGTMVGEPIMEYMVYDDEILGLVSLAFIAAKYPTSQARLRGFTVVCRNANPPCYYRKDSDNDELWVYHEGRKLV